MLEAFSALAFMAGIFISLLFGPLFGIGPFTLSILCALGMLGKKLGQIADLLDRSRRARPPQKHWTDQYKS